MRLCLAWRAALGQLIAVVVLFLVVLALPLPEDFFRDNGAVIGPVSWLLCSLVTGRMLALGFRTTLVAAVASGAAAGLVGMWLGHSAGLVVGIAAFGAAVSVHRQASNGGRSSTAGAPSPASGRSTPL